MDESPGYDAQPERRASTIPVPFRARSEPPSLFNYEILNDAMQKPSPSLPHPGPFLEHISAASRFPIELFLMLAEIIAADERLEIEGKPTKQKETARQISHLSLVCTSWSRILRPLLFNYVQIWCYDDLKFLAIMLDSKHSAWLASRITRLDVFLPSQKRWCFWIDRVCRMLARRLVNLEKLGYNPRSYEAIASNELSPDDLPTICPTSRPFFASYRNVKEFTISRFRFQSFSSFLHLMGELASLEVLVCKDLTWSTAPCPHRLLPHPAYLRRLRRVHTSGNTDLWAMTWFFAAMLASRVTKADNPDNGFTDVKILICLAKLFFCEQRQSTADMELVYDGHDKISLKANELSRAPEVELTLWPSVRPIPGTPSSAVCRIVIHWFFRTCSIDRILSCDWERLDRALSRSARNLQCIDIRCDAPYPVPRFTEIYYALRPRMPLLDDLELLTIRHEDSSVPGCYGGPLVILPYQLYSATHELNSDEQDGTCWEFSSDGYPGIPLVTDPKNSVDSEHQAVLFEDCVSKIYFYFHIVGYESYVGGPLLSIEDVQARDDPIPFTLEFLLKQIHEVILEFFSVSEHLRYQDERTNYVQLDALEITDIYLVRLLKYGRALQPVLACRSHC